MKIVKYLIPLGMISSIVYITHVILGQILWSEYNSITMDISSLTAVGSPNADLLRIFTTIYAICSTFFVIGMVINSFKRYHTPTKTGYIIFLIMNVVSAFGYGLFPLTEDKTVMNFQNTMHIIVTILVVLTTLISLYMLAYGYLKKEKLKFLGSLSLITAILITVFGVLNPIGMANNWNILGLTERLVIFTLQTFTFIISYTYTFRNNTI